MIVANCAGPFCLVSECDPDTGDGTLPGSIYIHSHVTPGPPHTSHPTGLIATFLSVSRLVQFDCFLFSNGHSELTGVKIGVKLSVLL